MWLQVEPCAKDRAPENFRARRPVAPDGSRNRAHEDAPGLLAAENLQVMTANDLLRNDLLFASSVIFFPALLILGFGILHKLVVRLVVLAVGDLAIEISDVFFADLHKTWLGQLGVDVVGHEWFSNFAAAL